ncbi:hypothetical protein [Nostoc sp. PCC 7524]|uniref:hypothetical protein n=1 Tax=Nostoc sp. (strain ATCC 29411 / PCC 7524) TaxID=28072 RepID=UPI000A7510AC|nr:hypothetical protein [Nostoc sp. PCC 7524]
MFIYTFFSLKLQKNRHGIAQKQKSVQASSTIMQKSQAELRLQQIQPEFRNWSGVFIAVYWHDYW